jgi:hypothetical protein
MLEMMEFNIDRAVGPIVEPFGIGHPPESRSLVGKIRAKQLGGYGVPKSAVLCRTRD